MPAILSVNYYGKFSIGTKPKNSTIYSIFMFKANKFHKFL